ncbi:hypothetical protein BDZ91DRAFT_848728 [Kalaharituber pfeilii]|nr:hypothetical protein BDZ91DRAFT_848728 [Kalaharituber pfeilii]
MSQYDIVARALLALANLAGEDEGFYDHLREEEGELIEERITPTDRQELTVAQGVKETTPAVYLSRQTERIVFCLGPENDLRYYNFEHDLDEWQDDHHAIENAINLHPQTKLAAGNLQSNASVFYQNNEGTLNCISTTDFHSWTLQPPLTAAVNPIQGTSLQVLERGSDELRLYYISSDRFIHYLAFSGSIDSQIDHKVEYANIDEYQVKNFIVYPTRSDPALFILGEDSSVTSYLPNGMTQIGTISDTGDLVLANKDELFDVHIRICTFPIVEPIAI